MRRLTIVLLAVAAVATVAAAGPPAAIVNKQLEQRNHRTFSSPAQMARSIFDGSSKVQRALSVITAATLLGAGAATLAGVWQTIRGERGGVSLASSGVYGLVGLLAALAVIR